MKRIYCFFFGHNDVPFEMKNWLYRGKWSRVIYSWRCRRCGNIREYEP